MLIDSSQQPVDVEQERKRLEQELAYAQGFLDYVNNKLQNEKFVANVKPEVLEKEYQKREDTQSKIEVLTEALSTL